MMVRYHTGVATNVSPCQRYLDGRGTLEEGVALDQRRDGRCYTTQVSCRPRVKLTRRFGSKDERRQKDTEEDEFGVKGVSVAIRRGDVDDLQADRTGELA